MSANQHRSLLRIFFPPLGLPSMITSSRNRLLRTSAHSGPSDLREPMSKQQPSQHDSALSLLRNLHIRSSKPSRALDSDLKTVEEEKPHSESSKSTSTKLVRRRPASTTVDRTSRPETVHEVETPTVPLSACVSRDPTYYDDNIRGSACVFLVENTLFKTPNNLLMRDESAFHDMFSLPTNDEDEGACDDNPICLHDTVDQFRALLWVLSALPQELQLETVSCLPPIERLLDIAEITHKYHFASYESWALEALFRSTQDGNTISSLVPFSYARLLAVSILSDHEPLRESVIEYLHARILHDHRFVPTAVRATAENYGTHKLVSALSYRELVNDEPRYARRKHAANRSELEVQDMLNHPPRFSLYILWKSLRNKPPAFDPSESCDSHCLGQWRGIWKQTYDSPLVARFAPVDVVGRLRCMQELLGKWDGLRSQMDMPCALAALEALEMLIDEVIADLGSHF